MAKPLTAAVTGLASTFLSSVPTGQPAQSHPPASAVSQQHQSAAASVVPPSHPANAANSASQPPSTAVGPSSQQTQSPGQPQSHLNGAATTAQSAAPEDQALQLEEEPWLEEEMMLEKEARTPPAQPEEAFPMEEKEEHSEESRPSTPVEEEEMLPER